MISRGSDVRRFLSLTLWFFFSSYHGEYSSFKPLSVMRVIQYILTNAVTVLKVSILRVVDEYVRPGL